MLFFFHNQYDFMLSNDEFMIDMEGFMHKDAKVEKFQCELQKITLLFPRMHISAKLDSLWLIQ